MLSIINSEDQQKMVSCFYGLPSLSWLEGKTEDQQDVWRRVSLQFSLLRGEFQAYFSGQASTLGDLPPSDQDLIEAWRDHYLTFYELLRDLWSDIVSIREAGYFPEIKGISSPGELLIAILKDDCMAALIPCQTNHEFSPSKRYKLGRTGALIQQALEEGYSLEEIATKGIETNKGKVVTPRKKNRGKLDIIQEFHRDVTKDSKVFSVLAFRYMFCLWIATELARINPGSAVKRKLDLHRAASKRTGKILLREFKRMKGEAWRNGQRHIGSQGTYKKPSA